MGYTFGGSEDAFAYKNKYEIVGELQKQIFETEDDMMQWLHTNNKVVSGDPLTDDEISMLTREYAPNYVKTYGDISGLLNEVTNIPVGGSTAGAMGYGEFLKNFGSDTQKNYSEAVRTANDDYYRALTTYGKSAEAMAGAGLSGSGVSDYGGAAAWASRQGAVSVAGAAKQAADAENARSYSQYLESYKAQADAAAANSNAMRAYYMEKALGMGSTDAKALTDYLRSTGYFSEEEAEQYASTMASYHAGEQQKAEDAANEEKKRAAINTAMQSGLKGEALKAYLAYNGFTTEEIESTTKQIEPIQRVDEETQNKTAYTEYLNLLAGGMSVGEAENYIRSQYGDATAEYVKVTKETGERSTAVKSFTDSLAILENDTSGYNPFAEGVPTIAQLDAAKAQYGIDDETYNGIKNRICTLNEKWISDNMSMAREGDQIDRVLSNLGITATEGADEEEMQKEAIKALKSRAFDLYYKGEITQQNMTNVLSDYYTEEIEAAKDAGHDKKLQTACAALVQAKQDGEKLGDTEFYQNMVDKLAMEVKLYEMDNNEVQKSMLDGIYKGFITSGILGAVTGWIGGGSSVTTSYKMQFGNEMIVLPSTELLKLAGYKNYIDTAIITNDYSMLEEPAKAFGVDDAKFKEYVAGTGASVFDLPTMYDKEQINVLYDVMRAAEKNQGLERKNGNAVTKNIMDLAKAMKGFGKGKK